MILEVMVYIMVGYDAQHPKGAKLAEFNTIVECTQMMQNPVVQENAQREGIRLECRAVKK